MERDNNGKVAALAGARIRALRRQRRMSIKDFAAETDISPAHVSLIERNLIEPSLSVLRRITETLGVTVPALLADEIGDFMVNTPGRENLSFSDGVSTYRFCTPSALTSGRPPQLSATAVCIPKLCWDHQEQVTHEWEEYMYVISGCIEVHADDYVATANTGDSIYVKAGIPHKVYNPLKVDANVLAVYNSL